MVDNNKEVEYLLSRLEDISYDEEGFRIMVGKEKYVYGAISFESELSAISKIIQYNL